MCDIVMFHQGENIQKTINKIRTYYLFPENSKKCAHFFIFIFFNLIYFPVTTVISQITMLQQQRAIRPCVHGLNSTGSLGSGIWARQMQVPTPLLIDVEMGDRLVTIPIGRNEMCSVISEKLELDLDQCYLMLDNKPLQWGRSLVDYDISKRCTIQVVPILCGGGTIFSVLFCFAFDVFYVVFFFSLFDTTT